MANELELLRSANPVPQDGPNFGDGPLDYGAERRLERLLRERPSGRLRHRLLPGPCRTRLAWGLVATAVVAALTLTLVLSGPDTTPAVAAPRPLVVETGSTPVPLDRLAERAGADGVRELLEEVLPRQRAEVRCRRTARGDWADGRRKRIDPVRRRRVHDRSGGAHRDRRCGDG